MNRATIRLVIYFVSLIGFPVLAFFYVFKHWSDNFIALNAAYLSLLIMLRFGNLESFLILPSLKRHWHQHSKIEKPLVLTGGSYAPPILTISIADLLGDKNVDTLAKVKVFVAESSAYLSRFRNQLLGMIFLNILLIVGLLLVSKAKSIETKTNAQNFQYTIQLALSYFGVIVQLVWLSRVLLHYKERNNNFYAEISALDSNTERR